jgi:hypothetical protein
MIKRTPAQFRRQLLEVLRKIRDEGPVRKDFGLWVNIDELIKTTMIVECIVVDILINRAGGANRTSWVGDVWKNPHMLGVMHKMISFLENDDRYVWAKPSRFELMRTENILLKKEVAELKKKLQPFMLYEYHEIGEGDWRRCDKEWFLYCEKSPEHDTRSSVINLRDIQAAAIIAAVDLVKTKTNYTVDDVLDHLNEHAERVKQGNKKR